MRIKIGTSWGNIEMYADHGKIRSCSLPTLNRAPRTVFKLGAISAAGVLSDDVLLRAVGRFVRAQFSGCAAEPPPFDMPRGPAFHCAVWNALLGIPAGETRSYGELARALGRPRAARAVGRACGANPLPLIIPCHRVVSANGGLGGYSSGGIWKKLLLERAGQASSAG